MMMYPYKIVASDLDGTLLNNDSRVSEENLQAIAELDEKGVFFVPATGRNYSELIDELKNNDHIRFLLLSNGAVVYDKITGDHICNCMEKEVVCRVLDILDEYDVHLAVRQGGKTFVDAAKIKDTNAAHYHFSSAHVNVLEKYSVPVEDFSKFVRTANGVEVFSAHFAKASEYEACAERFLALDGIKIAKFPPVAIEIFSVNAGKGRALHLLADKLGIAHEETIAVGDSLNDYTMIEAAGLGLGVSNAIDDLKAICDETICSNEEHAIEYINKHYFS